ncbi:MAG: hypothetical protein Q4F07_00400 [Bacteroidales bacterium]|nr:hypothetical protein [Bacteroidales bacterium]
MKKFRVSAALAALAAVMLMASCSGNDSIDGKLDRFVSDKTDIVITGDISRTIGATGSTVEDGKIKPSESLDELLSLMGSRERSRMEEIMEFKGMDWSNCLLALKFKDIENPDFLLVWNVDDEKDFAKSMADAISDFEVDETDGYVTVGDEEGTLLLKDKLAILPFKHAKPMKASRAIDFVEAWEADVKDNPLSAWKKERLEAEHICNVLVDARNIGKLVSNDYSYRMALASMPEMAEYARKALKGVYCGYFDIAEKTATMEVEIFDQEGKALNLYKDNGEIDTGLLKYGNKDDIFVAAAGDMNKIAQYVRKNIPQSAMRDSMTLEIFDTFMGNLGSTIMVMGGPVDLQEVDELNGWNLVGCVKFKDNASAAKALDTAVALMEMSGTPAESHTPGVQAVVKAVVDYKYNYDSYSYSYYDYDSYRQPVYATFYAKVDGNVLVVSNANVKGGGCPVNADAFNGALAGVAWNVEKNSNVAAALNAPFGTKGSWTGTGNSSKLTITLTDTDKNFLETLMGLIGSNIK